MSSVSEYFSQSYAEARGKFLAATEAAGLDIESHPHPMLGRDGEPLAMDEVREGPRDAAGLLIVSSACHRVEGYCGSGVQFALMMDAGWHEHVKASGIAVLYIHARPIKPTMPAKQVRPRLSRAGESSPFPRTCRHTTAQGKTPPSRTVTTRMTKRSD